MPKNLWQLPPRTPSNRIVRWTLTNQNCRTQDHHMVEAEAHPGMDCSEMLLQPVFVSPFHVGFGSNSAGRAY